MFAILARRPIGYNREGIDRYFREVTYMLIAKVTLFLTFAIPFVIAKVTLFLTFAIPFAIAKVTFFVTFAALCCI